MDQNLIYAKTPSGDEAVRQSTRVVQRNLRMVLVQVDGKLTVGELATKIGNPKMVEQSLRELEEGGFIAPVLEAASVWEEAKRKIAERAAMAPASQFSTFGPRDGVSTGAQQADPRASDSGSIPSVFSTFGRPAVPAENAEEEEERSLIAKLSGALTLGESEEVHAPPREFKAIKLVWGLLGALVLGVLTLFLFPYNNYRLDVEAALARALVAPVKVEDIGFVALPRAGLAIRGVTVGTHGDSKIAEIRLASPFALFGGGQKVLSGVEAIGLRFSADQLSSLAAAPSGSPSGLIISQMIVRDAQLAAGGTGLETLGGEIFFKNGGGLEKLSLRTEDRSLRIEALPSAMGLTVSVEGFGWKPIADGPYVFESLQAHGVLQKGKLVLQDIDTNFLGGVLKGTLLVDWTNGLAVAGDAALTRLSAGRFGEVIVPPLKIEGDLSGSVKLRGAAADWAGLRATLEGSMDLEITRGSLHGVDLGEAARRGSGRTTRGGQTKFEKLRGYLRFTPTEASSSDLKLSAGLLTAEGQFTARAGGRVEATANVVIQSSVSAVRMPVRISGELPDLVASAGR